jgi:hypothetical protein
MSICPPSEALKGGLPMPVSATLGLTEPFYQKSFGNLNTSGTVKK